jgi:DNA-binding NarL/FixJ family response regulator
MPFQLLIVDDSELVRTSLRKHIAYATDVALIREVCTLGDALIDAKRHPPILVILDLQLPDGVGMNIIQPLKELAPASRIAILTSHGDPEIRACCLALGADWFFDKATEISSLMDVVRQLASSHATNSPNPDNRYE